jgi:hypothetical protein
MVQYVPQSMGNTQGAGHASATRSPLCSLDTGGPHGCGNGSMSASLEIRKPSQSHAFDSAMPGACTDARTALPTKNLLAEHLMRYDCLGESDR